MASAQIHPLIKRLNIEVGDWVRIDLSKRYENDERFFIISDIDNDQLVIHPGSRPDRLYTLTLQIDQKGWILRAVDEKDDTDWRHVPHRFQHERFRKSPLYISWNEEDEEDEEDKYDEYDPFGEYRESNDENTTIVFIHHDDPEFTDYREIREHVMDVAIRRELEAKKSGSKKLVFDVARGLVGYSEEITIRAYTKLGGLVSYMNWLESLNLKISTELSDDGTWDQLDPLEFSISSFETIDEMVDHFLDTYEYFIEEVEEDTKEINFPGPLPPTYRVKPSRS